MNKFKMKDIVYYIRYRSDKPERAIVMEVPTKTRGTYTIEMDDGIVEIGIEETEMFGDEEDCIQEIKQRKALVVIDKY